VFHVKRLDELVERYGLDAGMEIALGVLLEQLAAPEAPTSVHDPAEAVDVHLADSLIALELPEVEWAGWIADLGAGGGLPGLVLAATLPDTRVALVESQRRKCAFLEAAVEAMGLTNADVVCARAEEWEAGLGACDVVTARAVGALPVLIEYAAPLLREGGVLVAWKGHVDAREEADGAAAAQVLGLAPAAVRSVAPYAGSERRTLHVLRKIAPTPSGYPRRAGMAVKRPLNATKARR
jgi:16S rRNA (guanine527-N7)-methyltransferase